MKHVTDYNPLENNTNQPKELPQEIKDVLNYCWSEMKMAKTGWSKQLEGAEDIKRYLNGLGKALIINRIDSMEKLRYGLEYLYMDESAWLPSAGQFAKWCKEGYGQHIRQQELLGNVQKITDEKLMLDSKPFEERKAEAKANIADLRNILNKV